jgi:hypothetical protein
LARHAAPLPELVSAAAALPRWRLQPASLSPRSCAGRHPRCIAHALRTARHRRPFIAARPRRQWCLVRVREGEGEPSSALAGGSSVKAGGLRARRGDAGFADSRPLPEMARTPVRPCRARRQNADIAAGGGPSLPPPPGNANAAAEEWRSPPAFTEDTLTRPFSKSAPQNARLFLIEFRRGPPKQTFRPETNEGKRINKRSVFLWKIQLPVSVSCFSLLGIPVEIS